MKKTWLMLPRKSKSIKKFIKDLKLFGKNYKK